MGFFSRLKQGLERTRINLAGLFSGAVIDEDFFEELETSLIAADIGVESTNLILERLRDTVKLRGLKTPEEVRLALRDEIKRILLPAQKPLDVNRTKPFVMMMAGVNGAGKTTTFYMTTGLVTPNEGRVFLNDVEITKLPVYKRAKLGIGYLPQEASVFRTLTVEDNLRLVLEMTNTTPKYQRDKLESLLDEFHLQKVRKNLGNRLSGGERRRCEIARCLAINPKFIMLDEPFAGVDPIAVEDIQSIVYKLKEKNIGILITDHNAPETLSITDRAYLLFEGKILFQGSSEELSDNPVVREKYLGRNFIFRRKKFD